ncbi:hypothetical protein FB451DRAFT_1161382 [Mycena latifolia]|nr:hypothetical protein FB451DRAFT_1161382 [Mycena latifolia]
MQVTITRLPAPVNIVSIPRSRLDALSHPVLHALLHPAPAFLSITCNALELSLFGEPDSLRPFDAIARADALTPDLEPVEISMTAGRPARYGVFFITPHLLTPHPEDNAGARVNELSAPLAAAGISILYQSSYMSDFIFVKERRLAEAMALFAAAGFTLYAADPNLLTALLAPPPSPVLTRERSGSAPSAFASRSASKSSAGSTSSKGKARQKEKARSTPAPAPKSKSPPGVLLRDVRVIAPDLACVGLADDAADHWALKIVKLIAFPDLIPLPASAPRSSSYPFRGGTSPVEEECEDDDDAGYFSHSHSPSPTVDEPELEPEPGPAGPGPSDSECECAKDADEAPPPPPDVDVRPSRARPVPSRLDALPSPLAWLPHRDAGAQTDVSEEPQALDTDADAGRRRDTGAHVEHAVPFFSFTRTPEGSSLTAGARVLAALFPRAERHMVICGGELDAADREAEAHAASSPPVSGSASASASLAGSAPRVREDSEFGEDEDGDGEGPPLLSALQVDLRGAGLDTHGLVHRFSRALARGGVNHMYASTLRSANLLVPTGRARRAGGLLRGC